MLVELGEHPTNRDWWIRPLNFIGCGQISTHKRSSSGCSRSSLRFAGRSFDRNIETPSPYVDPYDDLGGTPTGTLQVERDCLEYLREAKFP